MEAEVEGFGVTYEGLKPAILNDRIYPLDGFGVTYEGLKPDILATK